MTENPSSDAHSPIGLHPSCKVPHTSLGDLWDLTVLDEAMKLPFL